MKLKKKTHVKENHSKIQRGNDVKRRGAAIRDGAGRGRGGHFLRVVFYQAVSSGACPRGEGSCWYPTGSRPLRP